MLVDRDVLDHACVCAVKNGMYTAAYGVLVVICTYFAASPPFPPNNAPQDHNVGAQDVGLEASGDPDDVGPPSQLLMSGCWTTTAQVSMTIGTMADVLPLASAQGLALSDSHISRMWGYMQRLAVTTKHNGATERSQPGLLALACRCAARVAFFSVCF